MDGSNENNNSTEGTGQSSDDSTKSPRSRNNSTTNLLTNPFYNHSKQTIIDSTQSNGLPTRPSNSSVPREIHAEPRFSCESSSQMIESLIQGDNNTTDPQSAHPAEIYNSLLQMNKAIIQPNISAFYPVRVQPAVSSPMDPKSARPTASYKSLLQINGAPIIYNSSVIHPVPPAMRSLTDPQSARSIASFASFLQPNRAIISYSSSCTHSVPVQLAVSSPTDSPSAQSTASYGSLLQPNGPIIPYDTTHPVPVQPTVSSSLLRYESLISCNRVPYSHINRSPAQFFANTRLPLQRYRLTAQPVRNHRPCRHYGYSTDGSAARMFNNSSWSSWTPIANQPSIGA